MFAAAGARHRPDRRGRRAPGTSRPCAARRRSTSRSAPPARSRRCAACARNPCPGFRAQLLGESREPTGHGLLLLFLLGGGLRGGLLGGLRGSALVASLAGTGFALAFLGRGGGLLGGRHLGG